VTAAAAEQGVRTYRVEDVRTAKDRAAVTRTGAAIVGSDHGALVVSASRPDGRRLRALPLRFLRGSQPRQPARSTGLRTRAAAFPANDADYLRLKVNGQTVLQELGAADNDNGAWATANVNLKAFAGQAVTITVEAADLSTASLVG